MTTRFTAAVGLPNLTQRFPELVASMERSRDVPASLFKAVTGATDAETAAFGRTQDAFHRLNAVKSSGPAVDTGLPTLALSLAPRPDQLPFPQMKSNVKPPPWWNVKYKNRWQADGSFNGNPVVDNIIEEDQFGHGALVHESLAGGASGPRPRRDGGALRHRGAALDRLLPAGVARSGQGQSGTGGVREPLRPLPRALRQGLGRGRDGSGAALGHDARALPRANVRGRRRARTPGAVATEYLAPLWNGTPLIQDYGLTVTSDPQAYVPPPLVGIWARWPYFHNGSARALRSADAVEAAHGNFYVGPADDRQRDFDEDCVGLPLGDRTPDEWKTPDRLFDSRKQSLGHPGHDEGIFLQDGASLSDEERQALIMFLKTL